MEMVSIPEVEETIQSWKKKKKQKPKKKRTRRKRKKPRLGFQKTPRDEPKDDRWFPHLDPPNGQWMP